MSTVELVVKMPEEVYREIMTHNRELRESGKSSYYFEGLIQNSILLPKGHGALKDTDAILKEMSVVSSRPVKSQLYMIRQAKTLVEADKEAV